MDYEEPELYESDAALIARLLEGTGFGLGFEELARRGTFDPHAEPLLQFADLSFPTPSGRIEIASAAAEAAGHPRLPQPDADPRPAAGRLRLLSPASVWLMNDSYGNDPTIGGKLGTATVLLHPDDAAALGLAEGDPVVLSNEIGRLTLQVAVSNIVPRGVALSHKGRWPNREAARANINQLNSGLKSDMGESTAVHGVEVEIATA